MDEGGQEGDDYDTLHRGNNSELLKENAFRFCTPSSIAIVGPTCSGKTYFTLRLIKHSAQMFQKPPKKIIYCYGIYQSAVKQLETDYPNLVLTHKGLPGEEFIDSEFSGMDGGLIIIDDLIQEVGASKEMANLFCMGVHHKGLTVVMLFQNLFHQSKYMRTISLNTQYHVLMKSFRDRQQVLTLARQMFGDQSGRMIESYSDAISRQERGYLVVSNFPTIQEDERLATDIFPGEDCILYMPL